MTDRPSVGSMDIADCFSIQVDRDSGTLRVTLEGIWNLEQVGRYLNAVTKAQDQCRREFGKLKLITDARTMPIQTQDVTAAINRGRCYAPEDRIAVVVGSSLGQIATRRYMDDIGKHVSRWKVFMSIDEAEAWLQA